MATPLKSVKSGVSPIPEGYTTVTPYFVIKQIDAFITFVKSAFDAEVLFEMKNPDGKTGHCEMKIGDAKIMAGGARDGMGEHTAMLYLYVPDCDAVYKKAIAAGGISTQEPQDMFYGDRAGAVRDQSGNVFWMATHIEDVSPEELKRRSEKAMADMGKKT